MGNSDCNFYISGFVLLRSGKCWAAHIPLPHPQLGSCISTSLYTISAKITHFQLKDKDRPH